MMLWRWILYLYSFGLFGLLCMLFIPLALPLAMAPSRWRESSQALARGIAHRAFIFVRWHCHISGFASMRLVDHTKGEGARAQLLLANHLSMFDIVLIFSYFPDIYTLVNAKFMGNPLLQPIIRACGYIPLRTNHPEDGVAAYEKLFGVLHAGHRVVLFPEGTRSADGNLGPLKRGPFRLAADLQIPITAVFFTCNQGFLTRGSFIPKLPGPVCLEAHIMGRLDRSHDSKALQAAFIKAYESFISGEDVLQWNRSKKEQHID